MRSIWLVLLIIVLIPAVVLWAARDSREFPLDHELQAPLTVDAWLEEQHALMGKEDTMPTITEAEMLALSRDMETLVFTPDLRSERWKSNLAARLRDLADTLDPIETKPPSKEKVK